MTSMSAQNPRLHRALREKCEWKDQRGEQYEQQAQAIDADQIFGADRRNPRMAFDQLEASRGGIEIPPQRQSASRQR